MSEELKPCPFCGGKAILDDEDKEFYVFIRCNSEPNYKCPLRVFPWAFSKKGDAILAWNTRT